MIETRIPDPYTPIDCDRHSEYELAILQRRSCHLRWRHDNVLYDQVVLPLDLKTVNHEEFLIFRNSAGETLSIRLDRIRDQESD